MASFQMPADAEEQPDGAPTEVEEPPDGAPAKAEYQFRSNQRRERVSKRTRTARRSRSRRPRPSYADTEPPMRDGHHNMFQPLQLQAEHPAREQRHRAHPSHG